MTASPALRLVVFDCDGTLVDSQHSIIHAMRAAAQAQGLPAPAAAAVRGVIGLPLIEAIRQALPEAPESALGRLEEAYREAFFALRQGGEVEEPLYPGILETLERLEAAGFLLGVATGKSRRGLLRTLETHGLERRFVTLNTADDGPGKPHPHLLQRAMAQTGTRPAETVMIGDTTFDMRMAKAAGVGAVGVAWGYHAPAELAAAGAALVVEEGTALAAAVDHMMGVKA